MVSHPLFPGSIQNVSSFEPSPDSESDRVFGCDGGPPYPYANYGSALYQLGLKNKSAQVFNYTFLHKTSCRGCFDNCKSGSLEELRALCYQNYTDGCRAIMCPVNTTVNCELRINYNAQIDANAGGSGYSDGEVTTTGGSGSGMTGTVATFYGTVSVFYVTDGGTFDYVIGDTLTLQQLGSSNDAIAELVGPLTDNFEDCYVLNMVQDEADNIQVESSNNVLPFTAESVFGPLASNRTIAQRKSASLVAYAEALSTWKIYDGGEAHQSITLQSGQEDPSLAGLCSDVNNCNDFDMTHRYYLARTTQDATQRVVRCSGKGCPGGAASCADTCINTKTALSGYGLIQDWRLRPTGTGSYKLCALANPSLCANQEYDIVTYKNVDYTGTFSSGAFLLQIKGTDRCLSRGNLSLPQYCDITSLEQRFLLGQYTRIESEVCIAPQRASCP
jgi:hypothetical protein